MAMKISVAMCTHNGARYLREQLDSIAAQTRPPDELIICDDCSTDETVPLVRQFIEATRFPVRLHINEKNLGSTKNFERAISRCTGEIVALADQDDIWLSHKLATMERVFVENPAAGLVFSDAEIVDEHLQPQGRTMWERNGFDRMKMKLISENRALEVLLPGWTITGSTMAFKNRFSDLFIPIPEDLPMIHDGWLALIIAAVAKVVWIDEPLIKYRQHPGQQIGAPAIADVPEKPQHGQRETLAAAMQRSNSYTDLITVARKVHQRLSARRHVYGCEDTLAQLEGRLKHYEMRANLPKAKLKRFPGVFRELISMRYHLYSNGVLSASKDLLS